VLMRQEGCEVLDGKRLVLLEGAGREGEAAVLQHELDHVVVVGVRGDLEVLQHGVQFPVPEQLGGVPALEVQRAPIL
jgi:phosphohistidine swiveling domain-containing protein